MCKYLAKKFAVFNEVSATECTMVQWQKIFLICQTNSHFTKGFACP